MDLTDKSQNERPVMESVMLSDFITGHSKAGSKAVLVESAFLCFLKQLVSII